MNWFKGEIFEGAMIILWGVLLIALALFFWKFNHYETARALILPIMVVGLFWSIAGGIGIYTYNIRIDKAQVEYKENPEEFIVKEKIRVDGFMGVYKYLIPAWSILMIAGLALFIFWGGNLGRAIGLAAILFAVAGLMVDHTSEQNAKAYHSEIEKATLKNE